MFFILSKILLFLLNPLIWILFLLLLAYVNRKSLRGKKFLMASFILFIFFSNDFIFSEVMKSWEGRNEELKSTHYDAVILLGGYSSWNTRHEIYSFNEASDRLIKALELYNTGKTDKIVLSGGSGLILKPEEKESAMARDLLIDLGMPSEDIILEKYSKNTHENAEFSSAILQEIYGEEGQYILVTSAFHMRRAKRCFEKIGLRLDYLRVDFQVDDDDYDLSTYLLPSAYAMGNWQMIFKEWAGYLVYWIRGYF